MRNPFFERLQEFMGCLWGWITNRDFVLEDGSHEYAGRDTWWELLCTTDLFWKTKYISFDDLKKKMGWK